jgi:hypothetical protein
MLAGQLEIQLMANMARLADDMNKAQSTVSYAMKNIERAVGSAKSAIEALGIGLSAGYFVSLIKGTIDAEEHLYNLTKSTGLTVKELAGLKLLARESGIDLDGLAKGIDKMSVAIGKDPEKFRALGVTAKTNKEALMQFADIFNMLPDIQQRNALAQAVFNKSWAELAPVLARGGKSIGEIIDKGATLSVVTAESAAEATKFNEQMAELETTMGKTSISIVNNLLPGMNDTAAAMKKLAEEGHPVLALWRGLAGMGKISWDLLSPPDNLTKQLSPQGMISDLQVQIAQLERNKASGSGKLIQWIFGTPTEIDAQVAMLMARIDTIKKHAAELDMHAAVAPLVPSKAAQDAAAAKAQAFLDNGSGGVADSTKAYDALIQRLQDNIAAATGKTEGLTAAQTELLKIIGSPVWDAASSTQKDYIVALTNEASAAEMAAAAAKKHAAEVDSMTKQFEKNVQRDIGDVLYLGLQGKFNGIADLFKQMLLRMLADAAAADLSKAIVGTASGLFGTAAVAATQTTAATAGSNGLLTTSGGALTTMGYVGVAAVAAYVIAKYGFGMGNSRENVGGNRLVGKFGNSGFAGDYQQSWQQNNGIFGGTDSGVYKTAITTAQSVAFKATVDGLQSTFNDLGASIGDVSIQTRKWNVNINSADDYTKALADGMGAQLLPQLEKFRLEGETLAATAVRLTGIFATTNSFIVALGLSSTDAFGAIGILSADARKALTDLAGGVAAFGQKAGSFVQNFLSASDQLQPALDAVGRTFAELHISGIETNAQFADLVKAELKLGHYDTVNKLLSVADAFNTITKSAADTTSQLLALIKTDSFKTMVDYQRAMGRAMAAGAAPSDQIAAATAAAATVMAGEAGAASTARTAAKAAALADLEKFKIGAFAAEQQAFAQIFAAFSAGKISAQIAQGLINQIDSSVRAQVTAHQAAYDQMPSFASGGSFGGGVRIVGENGPELEFTGPSRIVSNQGSKSLLNMDALIAEIRALRSDIVSLQKSAQSTAQSSLKTSLLLRNVTQDGNSLQTTLV